MGKMQTSAYALAFCVLFVDIGFLLASGKHKNFTFPPVKLFSGIPKSG